MITVGGSQRVYWIASSLVPLGLVAPFRVASRPLSTVPRLRTDPVGPRLAKSNRVLSGYVYFIYSKNSESGLVCPCHALSGPV